MNERPAPQHSHNLYAYLDLREIAAEVLGQGRRSGKAVLYRAPWRSDDDHASFAVYADGWKDFGGGQEAGNIYDFLQRHYGWTFAEAQAFVQARMGGISQPLTPLPHPSHTSATSEPPSIDWQTAAHQSLEQAVAYLWSGRTDARQVLDYLRRKRGLTDDTIRHFHLGYNPRWTRLNTQTEDGKRATLPPGIVIPILAHDALWALRVRCRVGNLADWLGIPPDRDRHGQELAKYLNASGSKLTGSLFNGDALTTHQAVLLVEGEFDAMLAQQMLGTQAAVVTLGSASNRLSSRWLPRLQAARTLFIALDNDAAGQTAAQKLAQALNASSNFLPIPQGKDITEYVVEHQGDLRAWFEAALPSPGWWPQGVPDSWRRAALRYLPPSAALVLELLNDALRTGLLDPNGFTMQQVQEANMSLGYQVARSTLAKALDTLTDLFISKLETGSEAGNTVSKTEKNKCSGRNAEYYRALPLAEMKRHLLAWVSPRLYEREHPLGKNPTLTRFSATMLDDTLDSEENPAALAQELNQEIETIWQAQDGWQKRAAQRAKRRRMQVIAALDDAHSTPLPVGWSKHNAAAYRVAFAHALGKAQPELQLSRREVCELLGVANGTLDKVIAQAGWEATPCYEEYPVVSGEDVSHQVQARGQECRGYPLTICLETTDGQLVERSYRQCEDESAWMTQQMAAGGKVSIRYQVANRYRVVREEPLESEPKAARPAVSSAPLPSPDEAAPVRPKPYYGTGYNPAWVIGQLELALRLSGWKILGEQCLHPKTGELIGRTPEEMVAALIGRPLKGDSLLAFAREELGAVVTTVEGQIRACLPPCTV